MSSTSTKPVRAYTIAQLCKQFGVSKNSLYRIINDGDLETKKRGQLALIRAEDAQA